MKARLALMLLLPLLGGCGLGETASTAAAVGAAKKAELEQAQAAQEKLVGDLGQAQQAAAERQRAAESQ
jgi:hypothetical protein